MEVVDQPLRSRGNRALLADRFPDGAIASEQDAGVLDEPWKQAPPAARVGGYVLRFRQTLGVLLESLDAEQLGADRVFRVRKRVDRRTELGEDVEDNRELLARGPGAGDDVRARETAAAGRVAFTAPIARAVLGHRAGETTLLRVAQGEEELEIVTIDYDTG